MGQAVGTALQPNVAPSGLTCLQVTLTHSPLHTLRPGKAHIQAVTHFPATEAMLRVFLGAVLSREAQNSQAQRSKGGT